MTVKDLTFYPFTSCIPLEDEPLFYITSVELNGNSIFIFKRMYSFITHPKNPRPIPVEDRYFGNYSLIINGGVGDQIEDSYSLECQKRNMINCWHMCNEEKVNEILSKI
jgi:hypothetical protein